ncbi:MAG TPA: TonB family protein [Thermoanaerobaculia bacterium]|nr:TonB family protein [Thermoanaerobaculia bacterium]
MAEQKPPATSTARAEAHREEVDLAVGDLQTFAAEYDADNRTLKWALGVAAVFHLILLAIHFPELTAQVSADQQKPKIYVVQQVRFKQPPPKQERQIPQPKKKKVPIPDPTPDEPEPIRMPEEVEPEIDLPDTDLVFDIPEGPPPAEPEGPIIVAGDVVPPEKTFAPQPVYPEMARKARVQGVVIVQAIIDKQGQVTNVKVLKGLPMGLDQAAAEAVKKWKFKPATLNGKPVDVYYNLTVNFRIQ